MKKVYTSYTLLLFLHLSPQETSCKKCHAVTLWSHSHNRIFCDAKRRRLIFFFSFWLKTHNFSFCSNLREKLNLTWFQIPLSFYLYILFPLEFSTVDSPLLLFTLSSFFFVSVSSTNTFHFWWICSRVFEDYLSLLCVHPNHHPGRETLVRNSVSRQGMKWKHEKEGTESTFNSWLRERRERERETTWAITHSVCHSFPCDFTLSFSLISFASGHQTEKTLRPNSTEMMRKQE